ncbi:MAG: glycosyltransferase family 4 protein [Bacteroidetes bacterium]|nr:glycosyltransferase family 4 protein [Bacteroidota bacterium]
MDSPIRILILPSWYPPDGGYFFREHSESIANMGYRVDVLVSRVVGARKLMQAGISSLKRSGVVDENGLRVLRSVYLKIPGSERRNIKGWSRQVLKQFARYEKSYGKPDLILAHSVTWAGYAASLIRERYNVPYLVAEHRSFFVWSTPEARKMVRPYHLSFFEAAYRNCHTLVPVSGSLMKGLGELMPWVGEKARVIPNMIREDMFLPPEKLRQTDPFVFFWAGRLEHVKGIDLLLEAVHILKKKIKTNFRVKLAGKGSLREELELQSEKLGLTGDVEFLGRITRAEMQQEMQGANCFVLPTRYEAFGVVLIEAMASGLPVIATRSGGPDTIVTKENGLLIDPGETHQLAEAMEQMINFYDSWSPENIRSRTIGKYGQTAVMKQYDELFRQILEQ